MISTRQELKFYIMADRMMNRGFFRPSISERIKRFFLHDIIMDYLVSLRYCAFYNNTNSIITHPIGYLFHALRFRNLGIRLGFSIGYNSIGYGVTIPHYGTIVIGAENRIGNFAVFHTGICITGNKKVIGDAFYCSTGAKLTSEIRLGNNISVTANSVVNRDCTHDNVLLAGAPATVIKDSPAWYVRDGATYSNRVAKVLQLKSEMNIL